MKWCRCSKCGHKLFMYEAGKERDNAHINIKCSSCKRILDVIVLKGKLEVVESGRENSDSGRD